MAVYVPATSWEKAREICCIVKSKDNDGYTSYLIEINISPYTWHVSRRYKLFVEMHEKLVSKFSLEKSLIPPKKVFGNRSESFIVERQKALELYLQTLVHRFELLPEPLEVFLDFPKYEVRAITAALSETLFNRGDELMTKETPYSFSLVELHAIMERLKLTEPTCHGNNPKQDIAHLVEFVTRLKHLKISGSWEKFEDSNIIPNNLSYDLSFFKFLETLEMMNCNLQGLTSTDTLRKHLKSLIVHKSLQHLSPLLLCGVVHWSPELDQPQSWPVWECVTHANFSCNFLTGIDPSVKLLSAVEHLDLSYNEITVIENLETLSRLTTLNLSHNHISDLSSLHTRLGNIHTLDFSANKIKQLQGLSKLFSITHLRLQNNLISSFSEVSHLNGLPCLEVLNLQHNPLTFNVDYRPQMLLLFGSRAAEIELDHLKPSEKEMDTVSILQALKQARGEHWNSGEEMTYRSDSGMPSGDYIRSESERDPSGKCSKTLAPNLHEASKFRQQIEALRKVGGSDWLRLLNEMNSGKVELVDSVLSIERDNQSGSSDVQLHSRLISDNPSTENRAELWMISAELSFPEWLLALDSSHIVLKQQLMSALNEKRSDSCCDDRTISEADLVWAVQLVARESYVREIPVCILLLKSEIVLLKIRSFTENALFGSPTKIPELTYQSAISALDIASVGVGPCNAYVELKLKMSCSSESLIFLLTNSETTQELLSYFRRLYNIVSSQKRNPFLSKSLMFQNIHSSSAVLNASVRSQIIFGQRVLVSKALHKCHYGILHYVFVTPSHVVLIEERLHIPQIIGLDTTVQPQFHVCALVNVHTNINQIHLKDVDNVMNSCSQTPLNGMSAEIPTEQTGLNQTSSARKASVDALLENKHWEILYRSGSWLVVEFESGVLLHLNFSNLKQRNEFMDAFLCARSQKC
ncbi:nischarin-like [Uloborus diversus]|uniref:nischarin-like n=1 Tax=Uloborus diversus TaxID=327109 RepID=UPI00240A278B|nr:nischarin-like [Uloborus diversus]